MKRCLHSAQSWSWHERYNRMWCDDCGDWIPTESQEEQLRSAERARRWWRITALLFVFLGAAIVWEYLRVALHR